MKEPRSKKDLDRIIVEAIQQSYSLYAWKSLNGVIEKCEMKIKAMRKELNELELEITDNEITNVSEMISGDRSIECYMPEGALSFHSGLKAIIDEKKIKIFIPTEFSFFERRRHERVHPQKTCFFTFENNKVPMKKPIFDLGLGGVAIILPRTEKINLKKGTIIPSCHLDIMGLKFKVTAECISVVTIDRFKLDSLPYGGNKFSFRFVGMSKVDRDVLAGFIATESILAKRLKGA